MRTLITQAINERRLLRAILDGRRRVTFEPLALGVTETGRDALLCRVVMPSSPPGTDWHLYRLEQFRSLQSLEYRFDFSPAARHQLLGRLAAITAMT